MIAKEKEALKKLDSYIDELIQTEKDGYSKEYKESKWYREPSLEDAVGVSVAVDIESFRKALNDGKLDTQYYVVSFEKAAAEYGCSWWDDDLRCERCGSEMETEIYVNLRNIAASVEGLSPVKLEDFYEGRGM